MPFHVYTEVDGTFAAQIFRGRVAATPRLRRGYSVERGRGDAAAATWTFHGDGSRRRRGRDVDVPWGRVAASCDVDVPRRWVAATPRLRRGYSAETGATPRIP